MNSIVELRGVSKSFGKKTVLESVNLEIAEKKITGIIGASGSGKTTLLKLISGYYKPQRGTILYNGNDIFKNLNELKKNIGFATQENCFYSKLTVKENLEYFGTLYSLSRNVIFKNIDKILPLLELEDVKNTVTENLSDGMQRRFDLACALINYPKVLILDEPTEDLDPPLRRQILKLIKDLNALGTTIIITSHLLEEVEDLCDYVAIVNNKSIVKFGTLKELRDILGNEDEVHIVTESQDYNYLVKVLQRRAKKVYVDNGRLIIQSKNAESLLRVLISLLKRRGEKIVYADVRRPSLEEIFDNITKKR